MYIERIIYPVVTLGIGKRIAIWMQGCNHKCNGCINPELWYTRENANFQVQDIEQRIRFICENNNVDGITFTGGDPLIQIDDLTQLLIKISDLDKEILVYTGVKYEEVLKMSKSKELLDQIDILIDGEYIDSLNFDYLTLRGSENQRIIYLNKDCKYKYEEYIEEGRKLQNLYMNDHMLSVGIHNRRKK
ncbi:MAG: radical SAM protein [Clostridium sp.]|nr:radical SAM protein [Clostridium sp.]MCM1207306.1 radical SAM protein [Ruminococcus sp.]